MVPERQGRREVSKWARERTAIGARVVPERQGRREASKWARERMAIGDRVVPERWGRREASKWVKEEERRKGDSQDKRAQDIITE